MFQAGSRGAEPDEKPYSASRHRHKFAAWAAARAVQAGRVGGDTKQLVGALEDCGLPNWLREASSLDADESLYRSKHQEWCSRIIAHLNRQGVLLTFGAAAKLVAVYIKSRVVCGAGSDSRLASVAFPPLDRDMLAEICRNNLQFRTLYAKVGNPPWSKMTQDQYYKVIDALKMISKDRPFWQIEEHWAGYG